MSEPEKPRRYGVIFRTTALVMVLMYTALFAGLSAVKAMTHKPINTLLAGVIIHGLAIASALICEYILRRRETRKR